MICIYTDFRDKMFEHMPVPDIDEFAIESPEKMAERMKHNLQIPKNEREFNRCVSLLVNAVVYSYFTPINPEDVARIVRDSASHILDRDVWSDKKEPPVMRDFMHGLSCIISDYKKGLTTVSDNLYTTTRHTNRSFVEDYNMYEYTYEQGYEDFLLDNLSGLFDFYLFVLM